MSGFTKVQLPAVPAWRRDVYQGDNAESEWYPAIADQHDENNAGVIRNGPSCHSWEPPGSSANPIGGRSESSPGKRTVVENDPDVSDTEPEYKKTKIRETSSTNDHVNRAGNTAKANLKTVPDVYSATATAMWLIVEPSTGPYDAYGQAWLRPATQLCELLEKQLERDVGSQSCTLTYENYYGPPTVHYFEHDLRGEEWVQRRFYDEDQAHLKSEKQLLRVVIGT